MNFRIFQSQTVMTNARHEMFLGNNGSKQDAKVIFSIIFIFYWLYSQINTCSQNKMISKLSVWDSLFQRLKSKPHTCELADNAHTMIFSPPEKMTSKFTIRMAILSRFQLPDEKMTQIVEFLFRVYKISFVFAQNENELK